MPAINVARTDTFEQQRQKINQIGNQIFSVTQGGSDLATGNLKLGDGTRTTPSLSFTTDSSLGLYKSSLSSLGFVYDGKKLLDLGNSGLYNYRDIISQKRFLETSGVVISSSGSNYDPGVFNDVSLQGGSGIDATANITVTAFEGVITNTGENYIPGSYSSISLTGGSGTGCLALFNVDGAQGDLTSLGSGYFPGVYFSVPITGGSGTNALADIFISDAQGQTSTVSGSTTIVGSGYTDGTYNAVRLYNSPTTTYAVTSVSNASPPPSNVYSIDGNVQQVLSLSKSNTYRFDVSDTSNANHPLIFEKLDGSSLDAIYYEVIYHGTQGTPGAFVDLIVKPGAPTETIRYNCSVHDGMGADINISSGSIGNYGSGLLADIEVSGGAISNVTVLTIGSGYKSTDRLEVSSDDVGGSGSGFEYTISSVTLYGEIQSFFVVDIGQDYLNSDVISFNNVYTGGQGSGFQYTITSFPGTVQTIQFLDKGSGYITGDVLSLPQAVNSVSTTLDSANNTIPVASVTGIYPGFTVEQISGSGDLGSNVTVVLVDDQTNLVTLSSNPTTSGSAVVNFVPPYGISTQNFEFTIGNVGVVDTVTIASGGNGYFELDQLTVNPTDLASQIQYDVTVKSVQKLTFTQTISGSVFSLSDTISYDDGFTVQTSPIYKIKLNGGNLDYIIVDDLLITNGSTLTKTGDPTTYTVNTQETENRFFIDTGNGPEYAPNLTLYSGDTYVFDFSDPSNSGHAFSFSQTPDGRHYTVSGLSTTLDLLSPIITLPNVNGLYEGMNVGTATGSIGLLDPGTTILSIDSPTQITLDRNPIADGTANLEFSGSEYLTGVSKVATTLIIKILDNTPNLYYYCNSIGNVHQNMGGEDGEESLVTTDNNNPRVFGSGFIASVTAVATTDLISLINETGNIDSVSLSSTSATFSTLLVNGSTTSTSVETSSLVTNSINSAATLNIDSTNVAYIGDVSFGSSTTIESGSGNITTSGILKTSSTLNINDVIKISGDTISSTTNNDVKITPSSGRIAKVNSNTALIIPSGDTAQRPSAGVVENGAIRFNTQTSQYEGYNASTTSWSSLGGVRDIDGNTYILAELTTGANDNTLWFYNDNVNTLKLTTQFLDFRSVKKISSGRLGLPSFTLWTANTPVTIGSYLKYRNNLYEVTASGTTGTSGNEPTHTSGVSNNGTAQLTWYSSAVSPLEFTEVEELLVGPNKDCPLIVSSEIKLFNNVISTLVEDIVLAPNSGKKVSIDAPTSLVIPVGNTNQRGSASQGSIRFNTTISQFEGYSGTNWSSLGGVRDVDGNTYIIPETAPAANENILYFYNNGTNTLQVTTTELDFTNLDTITTSGGNSLALNTEIVTLDNSATTIDNTNQTSTFISTTKQYLDLGLSSGLNVDPVLRLDDQGDVYLNTGFGTGTFSGVKIFDGDLKDFELADYLVKTSILSLEKGVSNSGAVVLYDTAIAKGCRITVVSKSSTGKKSMVEYNVIDNGTDIFHNEFGSLNTSADGFEASFDITPSNETRITLTLSDDHATNDTVEITVLTQVVK